MIVNIEKGIFVGSLAVLTVGLLIGAFGFYAGASSQEKYNMLNCDQNIFTQSLILQNQCNLQGQGMWFGINSFFVAIIFVIVGLIASIISGIKFGVAIRKERKEKSPNLP